ncbi:hypothetical protein HanIR_Chr03g0106911 [Helianthus annuus]|nr:hypothetical protein HanIR_Chr03g0106911 [Helianthus annuus]
MDLCVISVLRCTIVFNLTKTGFNSHIYTATAVTDMYMNFKHQFLYSALKVFDEITEPNTTSNNVVVSGYVRMCVTRRLLRFLNCLASLNLGPIRLQLLACCRVVTFQLKMASRFIAGMLRLALKPIFM